MKQTARPALPLLLALLALVALAQPVLASAQVYRWVGPDGRVNYTDTLPPPGSRGVERRAAEAAAGPALPYALQQAAKAHPITLYTTSACAGCDEARRLLAARGAPFTEKTVTSNEDIAAFKTLGAGNQLPVLLVGREQQQGFNTDLWNQALDRAGYPAASQLPAGWRNPEPAPLVASKAASASPADKAASDAPTPRRAVPANPPAAAGNSPPGFRF